jgi:hypothetical protein
MYANHLINEGEVQKTWAPIIEEATGITEKSKLSWMSKYCHYHNLNESVYNTVHLNPNMNVPGMGATQFPGNPGNLNNFTGQDAGSGDRPFSLLPLAMQVAAQTVGLDLVPVVPMQGPMGVLTYLDFVYGGGIKAAAGDLNSSAAPLMIKIPVDFTGFTGFAIGDVVYATSVAGGIAGVTGGSFELTFVGLSRIDGYPIFRVRGYVRNGVYAQGSEASPGESIAQAIGNATLGFNDYYSNAAATVVVGEWGGSAELVKALEDHVSGFSGDAFELSNRVATASSFPGIDALDPYQRGMGESTPDNLLGLSLFNKSVAAMTYQVAAAVTREQVQDLKQFGIDAVAQVEAVLVNELTQSINKLILDRIFRLGVTNAVQVEAVTGTVLSAIYDTAAGAPALVALGPGNTSNATQTVLATVTNVSLGGETQGSLQRRILTKILASSNLIATRGRRGPATFAVTGGKMATAIQDVAGFVPYPLSNTVNQAGGSLYPIGAVAGVTIYVDPNRDFDDLRIAIGRKGDGNSPGLVFMPYLMAESVETIAEGTMAPKIAVKSRFALVEAGFHPQTMYYTLNIVLQGGLDVI